MDIGGRLRSLGLEKYEAAFGENEIDDTVLPNLTAEDLKDLGVGIVGHRRKLLDAIAALHSEAEAKAALPEAPQTGDRSAKDTAERRQVTVMFSDLVGSTALSARMDPEDLREVISAYQKCVAETVQRFGGFVAKYMGDGVLVYFGYPQAHEDDAERAVRAGLEPSLPGSSAAGGTLTRSPRRSPCSHIQRPNARRASLSLPTVVIIVAALMILGVAASGLILAHKGSTPTATAASTVYTASVTQEVSALPTQANVDAQSDSPMATVTQAPSAAAAAPNVKDQSLSTISKAMVHETTRLKDDATGWAHKLQELPFGGGNLFSTPWGSGSSTVYNSILLGFNSARPSKGGFAFFFRSKAILALKSVLQSRRPNPPPGVHRRVALCARPARVAVRGGPGRNSAQA